jgi:hypothetical protein
VTPHELEGRARTGKASSHVAISGRVLSGVLGLGSTITLGADRAPWWIVLVSGMLGTLVIGLQSVFPQDSADRLAWWRDLRLYRERMTGRVRETEPQVGCRLSIK